MGSRWGRLVILGVVLSVLILALRLAILQAAIGRGAAPIRSLKKVEIPEDRHEFMELILE